MLSHIYLWQWKRNQALEWHSPKRQSYQLWRKHNETQFQLKRIRNHWWKLLVAINLGINAFSVFIPDGALPRAAVRFSPSISLYRRILSVNWQLHKYWKSNTAFLLMKLWYPFPIGDGHMTWVAKRQYVWWWVFQINLKCGYSMCRSKRTIRFTAPILTIFQQEWITFAIRFNKAATILIIH